MGNIKNYQEQNLFPLTWTYHIKEQNFQTGQTKHLEIKEKNCTPFLFISQINQIFQTLALYFFAKPK